MLTNEGNIRISMIDYSSDMSHSAFSKSMNNQRMRHYIFSPEQLQILRNRFLGQSDPFSSTSQHNSISINSSNNK